MLSGSFREFQGIFRVFSGWFSLCPFWVCPLYTLAAHRELPSSTKPIGAEKLFRVSLGITYQRGAERSVWGIPDLYGTQTELIGKSWPCIRRSGFAVETHQKIRAKLFRGREQHWGFTGAPLQAEFSRELYRYAGFIYSFLCLHGHAENNSGANSLGMARRGNAEKYSWQI